MRGRFQRGKIGGVSPFFAFQDIVTSAMAVLIAIVMLLALYLGGPSSSTSGEPEGAALRAELQRLLNELTRINQEVRRAQELGGIAGQNPALLKGEIEALRGEAQALEQKSRGAREQLDKLKMTDSSGVVQGELDKRRAAIAAASAHLREIEQAASRSRGAMNRMEEEARSKEAALLAERAKKNQLWLIPDRSQTSKEPVLAVVSANELTVQRFDRPEKETVRGSDVPGKFGAVLTNYSRLDQYFVFYFRPSGAEHFSKLVDKAKEAGFEVGYDAIAEDLVINFNSSQ